MAKSLGNVKASDGQHFCNFPVIHPISNRSVLFEMIDSKILSKSLLNTTMEISMLRKSN